MFRNKSISLHQLDHTFDSLTTLGTEQHCNSRKVSA